ncbi:MAG: hypothetical protein WDO70_11745 [Alphaproteobacteria bacterium]
MTQTDSPSLLTKRSYWLLAAVVIAITAMTGGAMFISYNMPPSSHMTTLVWLTILGAVTAGLTAFELYRQLTRDLAVPLAQLAQSIENMSDGDLTAPIWGQERTDAIGALARSADKTRQYFAQIPDAVIATPDGPAHLKFNGKSEGLFALLQETMMNALHAVGETVVRLQADSDHHRASAQETAEGLSRNLQELTQAVRSGMAGLQLLQGNMEQSAGSLQRTQDKAIGQLAAVLPKLEERAGTLTEIVRLAGKQTESTLKQLQQSNKTMHEAAQFSNVVGQKFAREGEDLAARMFAAITMLRNGGKVLTETNEVARSRMNEILTTMGDAEQALRAMLDHAASRMTLTADVADRIADLSVRTEASAGMMASAVDGLMQHNTSLAKQVDSGGKRLDGMLRGVEALQHNLAGATAGIAARGEQIEHVLRHMRGQHDKLMAELTKSGGDAASGLSRVAAESEQLISRVEAQLALASAIADGELRRLGDATAAAAESAELASTQLTSATRLLLEGGTKVEIVAGGMQGQLARLDREIGDAIDNMAARTDEIATRNETRLTAIYGKVEDMAQRLAALNQLTGALGQVAGQLGQIIPQIGQDGEKTEIDSLRREIEDWRRDIGAALASMPEQLHERIGGKLAEIEEASGFVAMQVTAPAHDTPQLMTALSGIVSALGQISSQLNRLDGRLPRHAANDQNNNVVPLPAAAGPPDQIDQALTNMTDIFSSLRDRGDDVINRLNEVAVHLQTAADKIQKDS